MSTEPAFKPEDGWIALKRIQTYSTTSTQMEDFVKDLYNPNTQTYVGWGQSDTSRYGSIGIAVPRGFNNSDRSGWTKFIPSSDPYTSRANSYYQGFTRFDIYFDNRRKSLDASPYYNDIQWNPKYEGPVVWKWTKKEAKPHKEILDRLGNPLKAGDFIAYVSKTYYSSGTGDLFFGFIEKTTPGGLAYVKNIKLSDTDTQRSTRISNPSKVTKLNKDVLNQLMLRRLTF